MADIFNRIGQKRTLVRGPVRPTKLPGASKNKEATHSLLKKYLQGAE